jgi:hypothetical protein
MIDNLNPGTYCVTVTDDHGCTVSNCATIIEVPDLEITITEDSVCYGYSDGELTVSIVSPNIGVAPYDYEWSNGVTVFDTYDMYHTITGLAGGSYTVTVTDVNGDFAVITGTVLELGEVVVTLTPTNIDCSYNVNGMIDMSVVGGYGAYTYMWTYMGNTHTGALSNLAAGEYCVTVYDEFGCEGSACVTITTPDPIEISPVVVDVDCYGDMDGSITLNAMGGTGALTYAWTPNVSTSDVATGLGAGTYSVLITDANGCTYSYSTDIDQPTEVEASVYMYHNVQCYPGNGGWIEVTVMGGTAPYEYFWSTDPTVSGTAYLGGLVAGVYTVTVVDANGCEDVLTQEITQPDELFLDVTATNIVCFGDDNGTVTALATGGVPGYTYEWAGPLYGATQTGLTAGWYYVTATDAQYCTISDSVEITEAPELILELVSTDQVCLWKCWVN